MVKNILPTISQSLSSMREGEEKFVKTDKGNVTLKKKSYQSPTLISDILKAQRKSKIISR